mmetsp:Transcript_27251/g.31099  ORF Transcript_27251/g.31099 Transcript_27251/m.31099 type:complete len:507 (+) Transcript_27251:165-1685(+)|eukprot:CAMPEP_0194188932 /NCGR_PEP_ID=MMETSP0154-20130528/56956_1 /TAXON_ID=1049557 /ORGANISM="Thalassiothrix antarctica, Strain L6-D1" /LENGTH=506 /DNA_ID=CAMNT_0038909749 /DNA_START=75 /DNA_END=1595 /DNA_ORIENTATION=+
MTSIPYDPSLVLGQVVEVEKIKNLKAIAEAQLPLDLAQDKLNAMLQTSYKLKMIYLEMKSMRVPRSALDKFNGEIEKLEIDVVTAAVEYAEIARKVYQNVEDLLNQQKQKTISSSIESPINYERSELTSFPLAYDSLEFDVQYFKNESQIETSESSAESKKTQSVDHSTKKKKGWFGIVTISTTKTRTEKNSSSHETALEQSKMSNVEGTVVITANATHKNAAIISPLVLDPVKAVTAWNYTHPDDLIEVEPKKLMEAALEDYEADLSKKKTLDILSGCSKASSFVGYIHLLKQEKESSKQSTSSKVEAISREVEKTGWFSVETTGFSDSTATSSASKSLDSDSGIKNHANLICQGVIPSIVLSDISSTVQMMQPDAKKIMEQQAAIAAASNEGVNSSAEASKEGAKKGAQYMALSSEYMANSVQNLDSYQNDNNKVIDSNSMMAAFEDFIKKVEQGDCGVPTNFYIKQLTKNDIAKLYIRKFFPNGMLKAKDRRQGMLGISSEEE